METGDKVLENGGKTEAKNLAEKCPCPRGLCRTEFMSNEAGYLREISQKQSNYMACFYLYTVKCKKRENLSLEQEKEVKIWKTLNLVI